MPRGKKHGRHQEEESSERWLLTYADMITLLMALFMVLFSISSVNISKYQTLQRSLKAAFSGNILPGGKAIANPGATQNSSKAPSSLDIQAVVPLQSLTASSAKSASTHSAAGSAAAQSQAAQAAAQRQAELFARIKSELEHYAQKHGFGNQVKPVIEQRGLDIKVLTDELLFNSGSAELNPRAGGLLGEIASLINVDQRHPVAVEGNTDNVPIHSAIFASNWELSASRASTVVRFLVSRGVDPTRLTAVGNGEVRPSDSNETAAGRAKNRKVEIVLVAVTPGEG